MSSNSTSSPATRRRRAQIACRNCRKRKIKCVTNEEPPHNPCERCQRKGLTCEYVAVGEPSPPSTPALEHAEHNRLPPNSQGYTYASHSHLPDSTYSMESSLHNQMTGYPTYPDMGSPNSSAHLNPLRFPSDHQSPWPVSNPNAGMLANQAGPTFDKSYYPPDYLASSGSNLSQWNHAHDPMRSNAFDTRLQYYTHVPNTQNTALYGSPQSYNSMHGCWCGQVPCTCGGRR
ncbi:hypothetical protein C8R41DRAFT_841075 [Lentinula lateritia]|uniref:Zn(2)-C6 fungal-type domain-containing protein n=1 Tax=Lentinula lateritia TaxID=40482 RepID=A0ABQ8V9M7_9AGAR|nr:hypothetical protein C8R41DRAFT_841075 [Lentinula lateritia]